MKFNRVLALSLFMFGVIHVHARNLAEENLLQSQCTRRCRFDDHARCYFRHPKSCQKYIRCVHDYFNDRFTAYVYDCPFGTFFSESKKQCDHSYMVNCNLDPCKINNDTLTYEQKVDVGIPNCRSYWVCRKRKSYATCCASGFKYAEGYGCVKDATCRDHCYSQNRCIEPEKGPTCRSYFNCTDEETFQPLCCPLGQAYHVERKTCVPDTSCKADCDSACPYQKVFGNRKSFLHGGQLKQCPMGTVFRADICACALDDDYHPNGQCRPKVDLSFSENKLGSPYVSYFGLEDRFELGVGHFKNDSHIEVPFFDHGSDLEKVLVDFKFKPDSNINGGALFQVLMSNCKTNENTKQATPSLQIVLNRLNQVVIISGLTTNGNSGVFELPYQANQWNRLNVIFDGQELKGKLTPEIKDQRKGYDNQIILKGRLRPPVSSLSIGGCSGLVDRNGNNLNTYFRGQMDDKNVHFNAHLYVIIGRLRLPPAHPCLSTKVPTDMSLLADWSNLTIHFYPASIQSFERALEFQDFAGRQ